jgi:hypothetical protein
MSNKNLLLIVAALVCVVTFILGFMAFNNNGSAAPPANPQGGSGPQNGPAAAADAQPVAAAPPVKEPTLAEQLQNFESPVWRTMNNGMTTDITRDEIHIHGTSQYADWGHSNGIVATTPIPDGDFVVSVDIKIAKYEGDTDYKNPYIRVESRDRSAVGIFANPKFFYRLHDWKNPQTMSATHKMFGDEATHYHRMTLKWEQSTGTATATVDGEPIGNIHTDLGTGRRISLFANTQTKGIEIEVYFRNLKVEIPEPVAGGI